MDKIYNELVEIKISQERMEQDIKYHIKRTDIIEHNIKPIISAFSIGKWVVAVVLGGVTLVASIVKILEFLKH